MDGGGMGWEENNQQNNKAKTIIYTYVCMYI